jgi:hypothetical protein
MIRMMILFPHLFSGGIYWAFLILACCGKWVQTAKQMLELWWEQMAWKRRAVQLDCLLAIRRQRTVLIASLHSWMHATFDGLLLANAKCHDDLLEAQVPLLN